MKIHEYQAKAILAEFGVPVPRGRVATTPSRGPGHCPRTRRAGRREGPDPRRWPRQGGRRETGANSRRSGAGRRPDPGDDAPDASDRPRGAAGAACPGGRGDGHPAGAVSRDRDRSRYGAAGLHGVGGGRHGHRGSRPDPARCHQQGSRGSGHGTPPLPRAHAGLCLGPQGRTGQGGRGRHRQPLPRLRGQGLLAGRDQPPGGDRRRADPGVGRQADLRRQRPVSPSGGPGPARPGRGVSAGGGGVPSTA